MKEIEVNNLDTSLIGIYLEVYHSRKNFFNGYWFQAVEVSLLASVKLNVITN